MYILTSTEKNCRVPRGGENPLDPPMQKGQLPPLPHPLHLCAYAGKKGSKMPHKGEQLLCCIVDRICMQIWTNARERKPSPVGQWTSLLLSHEFMTTPSKLDHALPTLHPKHSNAQGAIIRDTVGLRVSSYCYGYGYGYGHG